MPSLKSTNCDTGRASSQSTLLSGSAIAMTLPASRSGKALRTCFAKSDRRQLANVENQIVAGGKLLSTALDQMNEHEALLRVCARQGSSIAQRILLSFFRVRGDVQIYAELNHPFGDIMAAQAAFSGLKTASNDFVPCKYRPRRPRRPDSDRFRHTERSISGQQNGADFSTPSLLLELKWIYSNHGSNKATRVGITGFEPATSSSRTTRAPSCAISRCSPTVKPTRTQTPTKSLIESYKAS